MFLPLSATAVAGTASLIAFRCLGPCFIHRSFTYRELRCSYQLLPRPEVLGCFPRRYFSDILPQGSPVPIPPSETMNFQKLDGLSDDEQRKFQVLQFELEVLRQSAYQVPSEIAEKHWRKIVEMQTKGQRLRYYRYLFKTEMVMKREQRKKAEVATVRASRSEQIQKELDENPNAIKYGLRLNSMFPRIEDATMLKVKNFKLARARVLGQPLVLDFDYDHTMNEREHTNTAAQVRDAYAYNRDSRDPFWLQICNVQTPSPSLKALEGAIGNLHTPACLIEVSQKSYLDIFPKERIVYLSYNADQVLKEFNEDDVYIIGAMVDKHNPKPFSMAKAKREGLRMAKLPLDIYLRWAVGNKNLTINQVVQIMCDMRLHGDWERALTKNIPKRKLFQPEDFNPDLNDGQPYHKRQSAQQRLQTRRGRDRSVFQMMMDDV